VARSDTELMTYPKLRSSILSQSTESGKECMEKYFLSCDPPICVHPAEEGFSNLGFKLFLGGLSAYLRALGAQLRFVGATSDRLNSSAR
jgi:hypothetical protein